ncbi:hypothetical protein BKA56DRAFT_598739 [Ilyonectria sp. MPI-CAGE-AT-0026]|nr:hypothetical protein BKA56DRAFT_598739 [Ilyonectria sp. MPI-CAGE-AT-0026]
MGNDSWQTRAAVCLVLFCHSKGADSGSYIGAEPAIVSETRCEPFIHQLPDIVPMNHSITCSSLLLRSERQETVTIVPRAAGRVLVGARPAVRFAPAYDCHVEKRPSGGPATGARLVRPG